MKLINVLKRNHLQIVFVFLAFVLMVLTSYISVSAIVMRQLSSSAQDMLDTAEANIGAHLREPEITLVNSAFTVKDMIDHGEGQQAILSYLTDLTDWLMLDDDRVTGFNGLYGLIRGEYLDGVRWTPPEDYIPQQRPWYLAAKEGKGEISATVPYIDAQTQSAIISFSQELFGADGQPLGVIALDVNVDKIAQYVTSLQLADGGYGVLLNQNLHIIAHPDTALANIPLAATSDQYVSVADTLASGQQVRAKRIADTDGSRVILFFREISNGWYIGLVTPVHSYYLDVYKTLLILSALGVVLMLFLSFVLVRLNEAKIRSDEKNKQKSSFLAHMSHEIRTPMNAIIGMANIAQKSIADPQKTLSSINQIITSSHHLLGILNDILDMSKIESGKMELASEPFSLLDACSEVSGIIMQRCLDKGIAFSTNTIDDIHLYGDKLRLSQILINLLGNAVKFTGEGGSVEFFVLVLDETTDCVRLSFSVADTGIGIPQEQIGKLFEPFEQTDSTVAAKYGGTGLGLSISQNLTKMMGGEIQVESKPGAGTRFSFILSLEKSDTRAARADAAPESLDLSGKRILLAEDVEVNRIIVSEILSETNVEITEAENGERAVELFAQSPPGYYDLIFMDVQMPVMNGYQATRAIRALARPDTANLPIIAMTANAYKEDVEDALASGMNAHLSKPIDIGSLMKVLAKYMPRDWMC